MPDLPSPDEVAEEVLPCVVTGKYKCEDLRCHHRLRPAVARAIRERDKFWRRGLIFRGKLCGRCGKTYSQRYEPEKCPKCGAELTILYELFGPEGSLLAPKESDHD